MVSHRLLIVANVILNEFSIHLLYGGINKFCFELKKRIYLFCTVSVRNGNGPNDLCIPMVFRYLLIYELLVLGILFSIFFFNLRCAFYAISEKCIFT